MSSQIVERVGHVRPPGERQAVGVFGLRSAVVARVHETQIRVGCKTEYSTSLRLLSIY